MEFEVRLNSNFKGIGSRTSNVVDYWQSA